MKHKLFDWQAGITVFATVAAILLFYDTLFGSRAAVSFFRILSGAMQPIFYGALIAYLLAPTVNFWEEAFFHRSVDRARAEGRMCAPIPRAVSLLLTWAMICAAAWLLLSFLLPELYKSIFQLFSNLENYYNIISGWIAHLLEQNPAVEAWVATQMNTYYKEMTNWLTKEVLPQAQMLMTAVSGGIFQAVGFVSDLVVGVIVSVYLLSTKERCAAHARKLVYGFVSLEKTYWLFRGIHKVDRIFSGFVRGKLLDSLIIGVICFFVCRFLQIPYTPLVSVIVGVTNIIPFFGPFLGAVPSIFLILLANPIRAVYFLIFIIILQQVDGNVIGPKILGDKTGLSSLWVIIAILVGGSFFGLPGMFFGVPVFACLYAFVSFLTRTRLRERGMPENTAAYRTDVPQQEREE